MSQKSLPNPGTYPAKANGKMVVYETEQGALCVAIPVTLLGVEIAWHGKHVITMVKSDGTPQNRSIETLKKVFGWDGVNPFDLEDMDVSEIEFEIVGEHEDYTPPGDNSQARTVFKIQWLNPPGGGSKMPEPITDRKAALAKWGSKFKALSGGASASKPATKPAASKAAAAPSAPAQQQELPAAKPAAGGPPSRGKAPAAAARKSSQEEVWTLLVNKNPNESEDDLGSRYYDAQDELFPGRNGELTPEEWGQVAAKLGV